MICIEDLLAGIALGFCGGFWLFNYLLQNVLRNKEQLQRLIGKLISDVYHKNIFPEICRVQGILQVVDMEVRRITDDVRMATRPNHHRYAELAHRELRVLRVRWLRKGMQEISKLKERFKELIKKYEPYQ